jgi:hypothetical protein
MGLSTLVPDYDVNVNIVDILKQAPTGVNPFTFAQEQVYLGTRSVASTWFLRTLNVYAGLYVMYDPLFYLSFSAGN